MSETNLTHPRRPLQARLLSAISPGLGHIYCGRFEAGLILFITTMAMMSLVPAALLLPGNLRQLGWVVIIACLVLWKYASWDAGRTAQRMGANYSLKDYNRASVYILFSLMAVPIALGWAIFIRSTMLTAYRVANDSMSPALHSGERFLVNRLAYADAPVQRGDIIALVNPNRRYETNLRRVVALPGDQIEAANGRLFINGHSVTVLSRSLPLEKVPNGCCFVVADRQGVAEDSGEYGPVPLVDVIGKVEWVYWPHIRRELGGEASLIHPE